VKPSCSSVLASLVVADESAVLRARDGVFDGSEELRHRFELRLVKGTAHAQTQHGVVGQGLAQQARVPAVPGLQPEHLGHAEAAVVQADLEHQRAA
jgi:hypothetical protein